MRRPLFSTSAVLSGLIMLVLNDTAIAKDNVFTGKWLSSTALQLAPLPEGREGYCLGFSSASVGGVEQDRIYMTHGYKGFDTGDVRAYDIDTNTWLSLTSSPNPRAEGVGAAHGGLVYCIGGRGVGGASSLVEAYNPTTDNWATLTGMNAARAGLAAATVGNKIYAIGGRAATGGPCSGGPLSAAEVYNIFADTWTSITPPPTPVTDATAVAHGGKIYLAGGCTAAGLANVTDLLQIYDPTTDSWTVGPLMPTKRASLASEVLGNTIYAIGGIDLVTGNLPVVEAYDIDKGMWSGPLTPKTTSASEIHAVAHGNAIYVPGSGSFGVASNIFEAFKRK